VTSGDPFKSAQPSAASSLAETFDGADARHIPMPPVAFVIVPSAPSCVPSVVGVVAAPVESTESVSTACVVVSVVAGRRYSSCVVRSDPCRSDDSSTRLASVHVGAAAFATTESAPTFVAHAPRCYSSSHQPSLPPLGPTR
jgi:hypothetical protein